MKNVGFEVGDKFVYHSKYGGVTFGVIETILPVNELIGNVWIVKYYINGKYTTNEILHYTRIADEEEMEMINKVGKYAQYRKNNYK